MGWDYVMKPILCYKTVPYQTTAKGCKTVMVDKVVPDCKYVTKTKQVPCTVKKDGQMHCSRQKGCHETSSGSRLQVRHPKSRSSLHQNRQIYQAGSRYPNCLQTGQSSHH